MPYYCNCTEAWEDKGHKLPKSFYTDDAGVYEYQIVEVNRNETCIHCGYAAFFSKAAPENIKVARFEVLKKLETGPKVPRYPARLGEEC